MQRASGGSTRGLGTRGGGVRREAAGAGPSHSGTSRARAGPLGAAGRGGGQGCRPCKDWWGFGPQNMARKGIHPGAQWEGRLPHRPAIFRRDSVSLGSPCLSSTYWPSPGAGSRAGANRPRRSRLRGRKAEAGSKAGARARGRKLSAGHDPQCSLCSPAAPSLAQPQTPARSPVPALPLRGAALQRDPRSRVETGCRVLTPPPLLLSALRPRKGAVP